MYPRDPEKRDLNRRLESISWGLFLIMIGGFALAPNLAPNSRIPDGTWLAGAGVIMLGLNVVRAMVGIRVSWFTTILGTVALASGIGSMTGLDLPVGALLLILIGAAVIVRSVDPRRV